jgi:hypothetical protein
MTEEPYVDASDMAQDLGPVLHPRWCRQSLPEKLYQMLAAVEAQGESQRPFLPHERAFASMTVPRF